MGKSAIIHVNYFVMLTVLMILPYLITGLARQPKPVSDDLAWAKTTTHSDHHKTELHFYFHDVVSGDNVTAITVVPPPDSYKNRSSFGLLSMLDDPLRVGPDPNSKLVGRAQGLVGAASMEEYSLLMALSFSFSDGIYNGSSLSILGHNTVLDSERELPVVGGTGLFRMARGYAVLHTYSVTTSGNAVVFYNVTVFH